MDRASAIDAIGKINDDIAKLVKKKEDLLPLVQDVGKWEGYLYKATVFETQATLLDKERVKLLLNDTDYASCLKKGEKHICVRISPILL